MLPQSDNLQPWPLWRNLAFRFCFTFLLLLIIPWVLSIPGTNFIYQGYYQLTHWLVTLANDYVFHVRPQLVLPNGSGDTSYNWAELWLNLSMAITATIIWSFLDFRRSNYIKLNYWLCLAVRYYLAFFSIMYGIMKLFMLQMSFPNLSQLATPLGDFLPMRLSWMFIGYSGPYQFFSGCLETIAGLLLLYRRTTTLGVMLAAGVFLNVAMMNLSYDIPVKMFSLELLAGCLFLLANEAKRIVCFFFLDKPAPSCSLYHYRLPKRWMRIAAIVTKSVIVPVVIITQSKDTWDYYKEVHKPKPWEPIASAQYLPEFTVINRDTIVANADDSLAWKDIIFMGDGLGSIKTSDGRFQQRYGRGYFKYSFDTSRKLLEFQDAAGEYERVLVTFNYTLPDSNTIILEGSMGNDALLMRIKKTTHHYQLTEKQFHWISEGNR